MSQPCFCPGELLLPGKAIRPEQWACPSAGALSRESWQELEARGENAPGIMRLLVPDGDIAEGMEKAFRRDAEGIYQQIIELFTGR